MKRTEIESEYTVDDSGLISDPGKFEGEPVYVPHFWDIVLNGFADDNYEDADNGEQYKSFVNITAEDIAEFPELAGHKRIAVWESDSGFVNSELDPEDLPEVEEEELAEEEF